jgi:Predicted membrane protein
VKLFSWIAGVALVLAALFFLSYSVEHGWLSPPVRASIGLLTGVVLLVACELRVARSYTFTANAMDGAGIAILYATLFAIHALWHLLPASAVFALMLIVTAIAVLLSIRRDSVFIALLGLVGGFATPALLSTGENKPIALFSYLLLLNVGLMWVAIQRRWPLLTGLSVVFTVIYEWGWISKFLTGSQLPLAAAIFLLFAAAAAASLWMRRRADSAQGRFDFVAVSSAGLPLIFAIYVAAVANYGVQYNILFAFLLLITSGLSVIAIFRGPAWLHLLGGATIALVLVVWRAASYTPQAWPTILAWIAGFIVVQLTLSHFTSTPRRVIAPLFLVIFPALAALHIPASAPVLLFGVLFLVVALVTAYAFVHEAGVAYAIAAFLAIATEGVWSADNITKANLTTALLIYAAFALLFLCVPVIARRLGRNVVSQRTMLLLVLGSIAVLFFLATGSVASHALWAIAILLLIVNAGAILEARTTQDSILAASAIVLSWIVITTWCSSAMTATNVESALGVIGGFALLVIGGGLWISRGADEDVSTTYLGLIGHLFLLVVAAQPALAFPPWPLFAVLFVLDLAIGVAALYLRRAALMTAAMVASQFVLMMWAVSAKATPWPLVAFGATIAVCAMALVWFRIDRSFRVASVVALFLGDVVVIIAGGVAKTPLFGPLLATHLIIGVALLALAWLNEWHGIAIATVALLFFATGLSRTSTPSQQFAFAGAIYALFIAYPLLLGARAKRFMQPYLAAVLAGIPFFFAARAAIKAAGYDYAIGLLPLFQAALMLLLVRQLLRIEPPTERLLARLALVAAAALAFITVAIPLQLDKQWITIGWALEGAALVWLFRRIPHRGLLGWSGALMAAVFVRLTVNPAVLEYHMASHTPIVNWYLYTYLVSAAAFFLAARLLPADEAKRYTFARPMLSSGGTIFLFFLLNIEIADFFSRGPVLTFNFFSSSLAQDLTYTIGWAVFAVAMLIAGLVLHSRATRIASIILLLVTVLKCFLHDLARLHGLYRVGSLLGLTISLLLVGVLLQKFVIKKAASPAGEPT